MATHTADAALRVQHICIITNGPVSQSPRTVKEADALSANGFAVRVVYVQTLSDLVPLDESVTANRRWCAVPVKYASITGIAHRRWRVLARIQSLVFAVLSRLTLKLGFAELAFSRTLIPLLIRAAGEKSDLYIAHNLQSLPVAAWAARIRNTMYAFDAEDLHCGDFSRHDTSVAARMVRFLQAKYLARCAYVTAASPDIGSELVTRYGIPPPTVVLNVFPLKDRADAGSRREGRDVMSRADPVTFYWYSQTISLDRGLQDAIRALGRVDAGAELHIRGAIDDDSKRVLEALAESSGCGGRVFLLATVPPGDLLRCAMAHDVGLCLETGSPDSRDVCITNKMFLYMLAGLAVIASATRGQTRILEECPGVGFLYPAGDIARLTEHMSWCLKNRTGLKRMQERAYAAAAESFNWEREQTKLVHTIDTALEVNR